MDVVLAAVLLKRLAWVVTLLTVMFDDRTVMVCPDMKLTGPLHNRATEPPVKRNEE